MSGAIAPTLFVNARFFQQREVNVRHRCRFSVFDVPSAFVPTDHNAWKIGMVVERWIAETAANQISRMIEQATVTIRCGFQLVEEVREEGNVICIDLRQLRQLLGIVRVMRCGMVRLGNTDLRIGPRTGFAGHLESSDACDVGLKS